LSHLVTLRYISTLTTWNFNFELEKWKIPIENAMHCGAFLLWLEEMNLGLA
jgi:hypothetical protein